MSEEGRVQSEDHVDARGKQRSQFWTVNDEPSLTVQSDAREADINEIMKAAGYGSAIQHLRDVEEQFLDVSEFTDYAELARYVAKAESSFMALHPDVREIFKNDVNQWLDTAHDQDKVDALIRGGHIPAPEGWVDPTAPVEEPVAPVVETPPVDE